MCKHQTVLMPFSAVPLQGTIAEAAPVVPISAQLKYNIDAVCEYVVKKIPVPIRDFVSPPQVHGSPSQPTTRMLCMCLH